MNDQELAALRVAAESGDRDADARRRHLNAGATAPRFSCAARQ